MAANTFMTVGEAAAYLGLPRSTFDYHVRRGHLRYIVVSPSQRLIFRDSVREFLRDIKRLAAHFGGGSPQAPPTPEPPADKTSTQVQEEAAAARAQNRKRKGYASTILTPREEELGAAPSGRKSLLGE